MLTKTNGSKNVTALKIEQILEGECAHKNLCPVKDIVDRFADKWSIYTILLLGQNETLRFNELKSSICGISQRMLTVTLRSLEEDGLVSRTHFTEIPPRVEYSLTPLGEGLLKPLMMLTEWANTNFKEIIHSRKKYAKKVCQ